MRKRSVLIILCYKSDCHMAWCGSHCDRSRLVLMK